MKSLLTVALGAIALVGTVSVASAHCGKCGKGDKAAPATAEVAEIELKDLKKAIADKKVILIDVNGTESFKKGHIPGAVDFQALGKDGLAKVLPKDKDVSIVAYCGGPSCNAYKAGATAAKELGYTHIHHFKGGLSGWLQAGEKTEAATSTEG